MSSEPDELRTAALALPREERAELAKQLIDSLDDDEIEAAWQGEVARRLDAYRSGEVGSVAAEDIVDEARRRTQT
jgi:putative addiction module component (TIGR02574 family)